MLPRKSERRSLVKIKLYDRVLLKSGHEASIVEIFKEETDYLADIDYEDGTETEDIKFNDIEKVID